MNFSRWCKFDQELDVHIVRAAEDVCLTRDHEIWRCFQLRNYRRIMPILLIFVHGSFLDSEAWSQKDNGLLFARLIWSIPLMNRPGCVFDSLNWHLISLQFRAENPLSGSHCMERLSCGPWLVEHHSVCRIHSRPRESGNFDEFKTSSDRSQACALLPGLYQVQVEQNSPSRNQIIRRYLWKWIFANAHLQVADIAERPQTFHVTEGLGELWTDSL